MPYYKDMDNSTFQKINDLIAKNDKIGVAIGKNPTLDEMAAALALYLSLSQIGKSVSIASATQPIVELSNLVGIDRVSSTLDGEGGDLIVSFPYQDGQIEKVSYNLDEDNHLLHIIVKAGQLGLQFNDSDVQFKRSGGVPQVLFVVGTPSLADLDQMIDPESLKDTTIINIDNKADNQGFGDIVLVSPDFSSVSEQIGNLLAVLDLPIDQDSAQNLLAGLSYATENFQNPNTSYVAFEMAAMLMRKGAHRVSSVQPTREEQDVQRRYAQQLQSLQRNRDNRSNGSMNRPSQPQPRQQMQPRQQPIQRPQMQQQRGQQQHIDDRRAQLKQQLAEEAQRSRQVQEQAEQVKDNQPQTEEEAPSDWLEPKVYKGSSQLS